MSKTDVLEKPEIKIARPKMFVVIVLNDPFTPREFVVHVLERYFQKNAEEATKIMLRAHRTGQGAVGIYTREIAETKADLANRYSREQGRVLTFSTQEE